MSEVERFEHESVMDRLSIQQFFIALADGIKKGRIVLSAEKDQALLMPAELLRFAIKTKKKSGKSKLIIKLVWKDSAIEAYRKQAMKSMLPPDVTAKLADQCGFSSCSQGLYSMGAGTNAVMLIHSS